MEEFLKLFNLRDILLHMLNTAILFVAITFLVYKPVRKFLKARQDRVAGELDDAAAKRAEANAALADAQARRREADLAISQAQAEGAVRAQATGEELVVAARAQAADIVARAQAEAEAMKAAAHDEIQAQALSMAVEIAEKMIGRELAQKDNATLAREFLTKVG